MRALDLNADLGEGAGQDAGLMALVSSANIACGGHAGDAQTMAETLRLAMAHRVLIGAHPGYADRAGFGRRVIAMTDAQAAAMVLGQVAALQAVAVAEGARVAYVKLHGALANRAAADPALAAAIAGALARACPDLALLAISGTALESAGRAAGLEVWPEIFADRGYGLDGQLIPRGQPGALIENSVQAADRLLRWLDSGRMDCVGGGTVALRAASVCIHGDSPAALAMAATIRARLEAAGVQIMPPKAVDSRAVG